MLDVFLPVYFVGTGECLLSVCLHFFAFWDSARRSRMREASRRSTACWVRKLKLCISLGNQFVLISVAVKSILFLRDYRLPCDPDRHGRSRENGEPVESREGVPLYSAVSHHQLVQRGNCVFITNRFNSFAFCFVLSDLVAVSHPCFFWVFYRS